jgi:thiosulfate/3-mercaptopyruvate sulfurtransferase
VNPDTQGAAPAWPLADVRWIAGRLARPHFLVLDATVELPRPRFDGDYRLASGTGQWRAGHVPGSRHADLKEALSIDDAICSFSHPPAQELAAALERLSVDDSSEIVVYDKTDGFWAARLWWMLRSIGVEARVLDGGWRAWEESGNPVERGDTVPARRGHITPRERPGVWVDRQEVLSVVAGTRSATLVCALSEDAFRGDAPTRYARRGHIPGSLNLPARGFLDAPSGRFKPLPELARQAEGALAGRARPFLLYCGGGISASLDALVLTMLGYEEVAIYDGSLQEWAGDPNLPLELGQPADVRQR